MRRWRLRWVAMLAVVPLLMQLPAVRVAAGGGGPTISGIVDNGANDAATPAPGDSLAVSGSGFGAAQGTGMVQLLAPPGSATATVSLTHVDAWGPAEIIVTLPPTLTAGTAYLLAVATASGATSNGVPITISAPVPPPTAALHITFADGGRAAGQPVQPGDRVAIAIASSGSAPHGGSLVLTPAGGGPPVTLETLSWPPLIVRLVWPASVPPGEYTLTLQTGAGLASNSVAVAVGALPPVITSPPVLAMAGQTVTVSGQHFGASQGGGQVQLSGPASVVVGQVGSWSDTSIVFQLPASGLPLGTYSLVVVAGDGLHSNADDLAVEASACLQGGGSPPASGAVAPAAPHRAFFLGFSGTFFSLTAVDTATREQVGYTLVGGQVPIGVGGMPEETNAFAINPSGTRAYVALGAPDVNVPWTIAPKANGTLYVVDTDPASARVGQVIASTAVGFDPYFVAVSPDGSRVWVANDTSPAWNDFQDPNWPADDPNSPADTSGTITELDAGGHVLGTISLASATGSASVRLSPLLLAVSPDSRALVVVGQAENISASATPDGLPGGVSSFGALIDASAGPGSAQPRVFPLPGRSPAALAFSPDGQRLYQADFYSKSDKNGPGSYLNVVDPGSLQVLSHLRVGWQTDGLAVSPDGSRLYALDPYHQAVGIYDTTSTAFSDGGGGLSAEQTARVGTVSLATLVAPGAVSAFFGGTVQGYIDPSALALDGSGRTLYVADAAAQQGSVVDLSDDAVSTVALPDATGGVAVPAGQPGQVFVSNGGDGTVSVLNPASNAVVATVPVGADPRGVAVTADGARVLVSDEESAQGGAGAAGGASELTVLDAATFDRLRADSLVSGGSSGWVAASPGSARTGYVSDPTSGSLLAVDASGAAAQSGQDVLPLNGSLALSQPGGVAVDPSGACAYVADFGAGGVSVLDTATGTMAAPVPAGSGPSAVAVSPADNAVYVADATSGDVTTLDPASGEVVETTSLGAGAKPAGIVAGAACQCLYVSESGLNQVAVLDAATMATVASIPVGQEPLGLALSPDQARLYVADHGSDAVSVIDTGTRQVVATVPVGSSPRGVAVDPPTALYVAGPWPAPPAGSGGSPPPPPPPGPRVIVPSFGDLTGFRWAGPAIEGLAGQGILQGVAPDRFDPAGEVTRAQFATLLFRIFRLPAPVAPVAFGDVPPSHWAYRAVEAAAGFMPAAGAGAGASGAPAFEPNAAVTRQDVAAAIVRILAAQQRLAVLDAADAQAVLAGVPDAGGIAPDLRPLVATAIRHHIMKGFPDGSFQPGGRLTRAQAAVLLYGVERGFPAAAEGAPAPAPAVTGISPAAGPAAGGTAVTISGSGFTGASQVLFQGPQAAGVGPAPGFSVVSDTEITATSPPGPAGVAVDVEVVTPAGTSAASAADQFTYQAGSGAGGSAGVVTQPLVTGVSPSGGPAAGGTAVTVTGLGFTGATAVAFGGAPAAGFTVVSDSEITATSPAGTGSVDVTVTTPGGTSATGGADQFTYQAGSGAAGSGAVSSGASGGVVTQPLVTGVSPPGGPAAGGTAVTISGLGFTGATAVAFGGAPAAGFAVVSDGEITATSPPGSGSVDVAVTTPGGTSATGAADRFSYR